jgi:hypothetical protein
MIEEEIVEIAEGGDPRVLKGQLKPEILAIVKESPEFAQGIDEIEKRLSRSPIVAEDLEEAIDMLEAVLFDPSSYPEMIQAAIMDGLIDEGDAPAEYDPVFVTSMLAALYGLQDRLNAKGYARGGLTVAGRKVANQGQGGDSMLAHVNPREAEILKQMGGQGTINPNTGLVEYKGLKKIFKAILPVALFFVAGPLGTALAGATTLSVGAATVLAGSALGAVGALATGGNVLQGALMGGISSGLGGAIGSKLGLGTGLAAQVVGGGVAGSALAAAQGENVGEGFIRGGVGGALQGVGDGAVNAGFRAAGNTITGGGDLRDAATSGLFGGLIDKSGLFKKPSEVVVEELQTPDAFGTESYAIDAPGEFYKDATVYTGPDGKPMSAEAMAEAMAPDLSQGSADLPADFDLDYIDPQSGQRTGGADMQSANQLAGERFALPLELDSSLARDVTLPSVPTIDPLFTTDQSLAQDQAKAQIDFNKSQAAQSKTAQPINTNVNQQAPVKDSGLLSFKNPDGSMNWKKAGGLGLLSVTALGALSPEIPEELDLLTDGDPERAAMFNRQLTNTNWDQVRADAAAANMSLTEYTSRNFDKVQSTKYQDTPPPRRSYDTGEGQSIRMPGAFAAGPSLYRDPYTQVAARGGRIHMNRGGPLQKASRYVKGGGTGRSDSIPAYLSDGEYVVDAETVAMLGDGSNKAGADVLDKMRSNIRAHKGKALAKGKFSPDSKSPLTYLKGVA